MMHGMTGTSAKMEPLAKQLAPNGWDIFCPEAKIPHPTRGGFAWWLRSEDPTEPLGPNALLEVKNSVLDVISEIPDGPIIVGGFSQGAAIASAMLEYDIQSRIKGLVLLGTKTGKFLPGEQFLKITPAQNITQRKRKRAFKFPNYASFLSESGSI